MSFLTSIPALILIGSASLVAITFIVWFQMRSEARALERQFTSLRDAWGSVEPVPRELRNSGLDGHKFAEVQNACQGLDGVPASWWHAVDESLERYTSPEDSDGWFTGRPLREILPDALISRRYHASAYASFPGILTGLGLMLTFVAILLALMGVSYNKSDPVEPVRGIDTLINGLSGKFLSSIVALLLSVVFTVVRSVRFGH